MNRKTIKDHEHMNSEEDAFRRGGGSGGGNGGSGGDAGGSSSINGSNKRRSSRPGGRPVSCLNPLQLARKRAHDREAQRSARQRTKEHIETLERQLQDLLGAPSAADIAGLKATKLRNKALEEEVIQLRNSLAAVSAPHSISWSRQDPLDAALVDLVQSSVSHTAGISNLPRYIEDSNHSLPQQSWVVTTETHHFPSAISPAHIPTWFVNQPQTYWEIPVLFLPPKTPVDEMLLNILHTQRIAMKEGLRFSQSLSHTPNLRGILFSDTSGPNDPVSSAVAEVLGNTAMKKLPEKVASLYMIYILLHWQIRPTLDTYNSMPSWFSPRPSQLVCPHPSWVSQIKFPKLRDKVIDNQDLYANVHFLSLYTSSLSVNWPFRDIDIFQFENGKVGVTNLFEQHILKMENWSLTEPFVSAYPELEHLCRFTRSEENLGQG